MDLITLIARYAGDFAQGLKVTLALSGIVWGISFTMGSALGVLAVRSPRAFGWPMRALTAVLAGVPAIVFLFWLHYPAQTLVGVIVDPFITAAAGLSVLGTFMVADTMRSILQDFPRQYITAAKVCGIPERVRFFQIQLPLLLRQALPAMLIIAVNVLHMSLFASLISVNEIFRVTQRINSLVYRPVELYTGLAIFYAMVSVPLFVLANTLRARFTRDISER